MMTPDQEKPVIVSEKGILKRQDTIFVQPVVAEPANIHPLLGMPIKDKEMEETKYLYVVNTMNTRLFATEEAYGDHTERFKERAVIIREGVDQRLQEIREADSKDIPTSLYGNLRAWEKMQLTYSQLMCVQGLGLGVSLGDIGNMFGLSMETIKTYSALVYQKLQVESRVMAVGVARELGYVDPMLLIKPFSFEGIADLTKRERELIIKTALDMRPLGEVSNDILISSRTLQHGLNRIYKKLGIHSDRRELANYFLSYVRHAYEIDKSEDIGEGNGLCVVSEEREGSLLFENEESIGDHKERIYQRSQSIREQIEEKYREIRHSEAVDLFDDEKRWSDIWLEKQLTSHELIYLQLLGLGLSGKEIASDLGVTYKTCKNNLTKIYAKLGVNSGEAAIFSGWGHGYIDPKLMTRQFDFENVNKLKKKEYQLFVALGESMAILRDIAHNHGNAQSTVKNNLSMIYEKLGVPNRRMLLLYYQAYLRNQAQAGENTDF